MKQEDLDKTQLMRPVDGQSQEAARDRKFDTQPLPRISDEDAESIQPAFPQPKREAGEDGSRGVRELPPESIPPRREKPQNKGFFTAGKKMFVNYIFLWIIQQRNRVGFTLPWPGSAPSPS